MENGGYVLLGIVALCWLAAMVAGMIAAFPAGIIGLIAITGFGLLLAKAVKDRLANKEDDYYAKKVKK
ncbi:MAG: hypothetical protein AB1500_03140 [Bacillota bacterium]